MKKLFIIGNGFDLAHDMKTNYNDFRDFLIDNYLDGAYDPDAFIDVPDTTLMPDGDEQYDEADVVRSIIKTLDNAMGTKWEDIESMLGDLNYDYFLDDYGMFDKEDDNYMRDSYIRNQELSGLLYGAFRQIGDYFAEWVASIDVAKTPRKPFEELINPSCDLVLNFNYTTTLEDLYSAKNVCHIHGTLSNELYFGHGDNNCPHDYYESNWFGAEQSLASLYYELMKNTAEAYEKSSAFFKELQTVAKNSPLDIYSYGFSFSKVDRYYLKKICEIIDTADSCFYMNDYNDENERAIFANILKECGYKGKFGVFAG